MNASHTKPIDRRTAWQRLRHTPLLHLMRGRVSGSLDWRYVITSADLPDPQRDLVLDVVRRTRLWRRERVAVANELIAHFHDANEAAQAYGPSRGHDPVAVFGDPKASAKLIRRAKRRCRPIGWQIRHRLRQAIAIVVVAYVLAALWLATGKPEPSVDYLAKLNAHLVGVPDADKAWPILREAMIEHEAWNNDAFIAPLEAAVEPQEWVEITFDHERVEALAQGIAPYADYLAAVRHAAAKPSMGESLAFNRDRDERDMLALFGPGWRDEVSADDWSQDPDPAVARLFNDSLVNVLLPSLGKYRMMARLLLVDTQVAVNRGDAERVLDNLAAELGLARLVAQGSTLIEDLVAISITALAIDSAGEILERRPDFFDKDQLRRLAHLFAAADAGMTVDYAGERSMLYDTLQRMYDPDSGQITIDGLRFFSRLNEDVYTNDGIESPGLLVQKTATAAALPVAVAVMADQDAMRAECDRLFTLLEASPKRLYPPGERSPLDAELEAKEQDLWWRARYMPLSIMMPALGASVRTELTAFAIRDALLVAIAIEAYRREHGTTPDNPAVLVPDYLPAVPMDLTDLGPTGEPRSSLKVAYREDGVPIVYGLGWNGVDDRGTPPTHPDRHVSRSRSAWTTEDGGDWILFPPPDNR
ncbi:MAG: hypothetical protein AAGK09_06220 [Planctomycetota bacterium]